MTTTTTTTEKKLYQGQSFYNNTGRPVQYKLKYLNCFDLYQEKAGQIEPGHTYNVKNIGSILILFFNH
jgi:hypothetical protein